MHTIELHPTALKELQESYKWYEERQHGLGERFVKNVNKKILEIADHPQRYALKKGNFRETLVEVFPFVIVYEFLEESQVIIIIHIFHTKRKPSIKYRR